MEDIKNKVRAPRSSFVTVLAWIFIVLSGFVTLISIAQNVMIHAMFPVDQMQEAMHAARESQNIPPFANFMFNHLRFFFGAFLGLSVVTLASSIALLKRLNWARIVLICLLGLGIVWNIGGLFLQQFIVSSMPHIPSAAPPEFQSQFASMMTTMRIISTVIAIGFSVLFAWIIKRLVSPEIRDEFRVSH